MERSICETTLNEDVLGLVLSFCPMATLGILAQTSKYFYKLSDNSTELFKRSFLANYDAPQGATHLVTDQNAHWKHWVIFISEIEEIQRLYWKKGKANINGDADAASEAQKELAERFGLNDKNSCWPLRAVADLLYVVGSRNQRQLKRTVPLPQLSLLALLELREPALRSIEENVQLAEYLSMVTWANPELCQFLRDDGLELFTERLIFSAFPAHGDPYFLRRYGANVLANLMLALDTDRVDPERRFDLPRFRCLPGIDVEAWMLQMSGNWAGRYSFLDKVRGNTYNDVDMLIKLSFEMPNVVKGEGVDLGGPFEIGGTIDFQLGLVDMYKAYNDLNKKMPLVGCIDKFGFGGLWGDAQSWCGPFKLWPDPRDTDHERITKSEKLAKRLAAGESLTPNFTYEHEREGVDHLLCWLTRARLFFETPGTPREIIELVRTAMNQRLQVQGTSADELIHSVDESKLGRARATFQQGESELATDYDTRLRWLIWLFHYYETNLWFSLADSKEARDDKTSLMSPNTDPQLVKAIAAKWRYKLHLIDDTSFIDGPFVVGLLLQAFGTLPDSLRQHYDRVKNNQQSRSFIRKFVTAAAVGATVVALAAGLFVYLRKKK